jgi:hypothetical protein
MEAITNILGREKTVETTKTSLEKYQLTKRELP